VSGAVERRFIADAMLGGLARWLRVVGIDVAYDPALDDEELIDLAVRECRTILTRDRRLVQRRRARGHYHLVVAEVVTEQMREVLAATAVVVDPRRLFSRCLRCNESLVTLEAARARPRVPAYVAQTQRRFRECPACRRVYWPATHVERMRRTLESMGV